MPCFALDEAATPVRGEPLHSHTRPLPWQDRHCAETSEAQRGWQEAMLAVERLIKMHAG